MKCPICKNKSSGLYMSEGPYELRACKKCGFVFRRDRVSENDSHFRGGGDVDSAYARLSGEIDEVNQRLARVIMRHLKDAGLESGSVLELGCGTAAIGKAIRRHYPELSYVGIEETQRFDTGSVDGEPMRNIFGSVEESGIAKKSQDALIMNHVLEHVPEPVEYLAAHLQYLKPGGLAYLEVPNEQWKKFLSYAIRLIRRVPTSIFVGHINFYTARSLKHVLTESGLEVLEVRKGYIGESADTIRRLSSDAGIFEKNKMIAFIFHICRILKIDRMLGYGIIVWGIGRKK